MSITIETNIEKMFQIEECNSYMERSIYLDFDSNPFIENLRNLSANDLKKFLGQYCHFPRNIITILVSACYTMGYHHWDEVVNELRDNIYEELGKGYGTI